MVDRLALTQTSLWSRVDFQWSVSVEDFGHFTSVWFQQPYVMCGASESPQSLSF